MKIHVYRKYDDGKCKQAMDYYRDVVFGVKGGEKAYSSKATWGKARASGKVIMNPEADGDKIMHMGLPLTKVFELYGCDGGIPLAKTTARCENFTNGSEKVKDEEGGKKLDDFSLWIAADSKEHADELFTDLSGNGGSVSMAMCKRFWGDYFGMCTDAFGTRWMISYEKKKDTLPIIHSNYGEGNLQINVYRYFTNGKCTEAFDFYKKVFGVNEFVWKGTYATAPAGAGAFSPKHEEDKCKIMHISLPLTKEFTLQGCDIIETAMETVDVEDGTVRDFSGYAMSLTLTSKEDANSLFASLKGEGGKVVMPLNDVFWGDYYGVVTDRFGNTWNVSYNQTNAEVTARDRAGAISAKSKKKSKVNIYRKFQGNCCEAFDFYKSVFGGDFSWKVTWSNAPKDTIADLEQDGDKIMHIGLPLANGVELMGCDEVPMEGGDNGTFGGAHFATFHDEDRNKRQKLENNGNSSILPSAITNNMHISISPESKEHADQLIAKLSANGGVVQMPMGEKFWGSYFGMCMDRFGTQWMFDFQNATPHSVKEAEDKKD